MIAPAFFRISLKERIDDTDDDGDDDDDDDDGNDANDLLDSSPSPT